jgi:hypothetical protein
MYLADLVIYARVEENALRGRRLAGVNMRHDADIASFFKRKLSSHYLSLLKTIGCADYQR